MVPGYDGNTGSSLSQAADLVVLDAAVDHCDSQTTAGVEYSGLLETDKGEITRNLTNKQVKQMLLGLECGLFAVLFTYIMTSNQPFSFLYFKSVCSIS